MMNKSAEKRSTGPPEISHWPSHVPVRVRKAYRDGLWLVPRTYDGAAGSWHPPFPWRKYLKRRPTREQIIAWSEKYPKALWAVITGHERIVVEFDGLEGRTTQKLLGLDPHIISPSGGAHIHLEAPRGRLVRGSPRVDAKRFPGMDLLAFGQTATIYGRRPPDGSYEAVKDAPPIYTLKDLTTPLQRELAHLIKTRQFKPSDLKPPELPKGFDDFTTVQELLGEALKRSTTDGRNNVGFILARDLRDEGLSFNAIRDILENKYQPLVESLNGRHPYTPAEAYDSVVSAFSQPRRLPRRLFFENDVELVSDAPLEKVEWLWEMRVPMRKATIIEGDPGLGKSLLTVDVASRVSRGRPMPGESKGGEAGAVLIISAEDDIKDTLKPRLAAAGARQNRIGYLPLQRDKDGNLVPLTIPEDLSRIRRAIKSLQAKTGGLAVKLVIIDPIAAYLSEKINSNNDAQVRRAMAPLADLAEEMRVAVVLVRHLNKDGSLRALYRGGGSIGFTASARSVIVVAPHPEQEEVYVLARVKLNLGRAISPVTYRIVEDSKYDVPRIEWGEQIRMDVETLMHGEDARRDAPARKEAERFLNEVLRDGPVNARKVKKAASDAGVSLKSLRSAKKSLHVKSAAIRDEGGEIKEWEWRLPVYVKEGAIDIDLD